MTMNGKRIHVLYVDDEVGNLTAFKATFRRDFSVHTASSAEEGMTILAQNTVHIVISDQRMPGTTGSQFLAQVKDQYPRTMRMLLTGYSDMEAVVDAINKGGIYSYCTKPWDPNDLKLRIEQAYEVHHLREQREMLVQRYRQVYERGGDPILIIDVDGTVLDPNPAAIALMGMSAEALRGRRLSEFLSEDGALTKALKAIAEGRPFANADLVIMAHGGAAIDCMVSITTLGHGPDGKLLGQAMIKDITDRKQEEARLRKLNEDLDRRVNARTRQLLDAMEDLGSFSYTVAHDLRSPLKNMLAMSEHVIEHAQDKDPELMESADRIRRNSARMLQLVDDLLRFSQTNTREVQRQDVNVHQLIERCIQEQLPSERSGIVTIHADPQATLSVDPAMLNVALGNILGNAIKYSRDRSEPIIEIGHKQDGDEDILWVKDNGVGFDGTKGDQAFAAFKRLHRNDQFEGTGVGLAIVQRIIQKHGGSAGIESQPGVGTTITLRLPKVGQDGGRLSMAS